MGFKKINYIHFDLIDSTNTWAKQNAHILDPKNLTLITAQEQTAGRGRAGKKWISPKGQNIYATLFFTLSNLKILPNLAQVFSLSCIKVLQKLSFSPQIKWPNDLLLSKKKFSGVLCETISTPDQLGIILGFGINLNMSEENFTLIDQPATSLSFESGRLWTKEEILEPLLPQFQKDLALLEQKGFEAFHEEYVRLLAFKGEEISCSDGLNRTKGILHSITKDGKLQLCLPSGEIKDFVSGEILNYP